MNGLAAVSTVIKPESISGLFTPDKILVYLILALLNTAVIFFVSGKFYLSLQQCGYHINEYGKWMKRQKNGYKLRLTVLFLMAFLFFLMVNLCFIPVFGAASAYIGFCAYFLFVGMYIYAERNVTKKIPLKKTKRMIRLMVTDMLLSFILNVLVILGFSALCFLVNDDPADIIWIERYCWVCVTPIFAPLLLKLAYYINEPMERLIRKHYIKKTKEKLASANVLKIGITGSSGKTGVKNILTTILSSSYRVLSSPYSYNTPLGVALTVNNLDSTHDIFIAEMGARYVGDIKELADIVKPDIGVLTSINLQHLETFGSTENIKNTKFELFENLKEGGKAFFSNDSEGSVELYERFGGTKFLAGINAGGTVYAKDIKLTEHGTEFLLCFDSGEELACSTTLLGRNNISNVCLAACVAYEIGMKPEEIQQGILRLKAVEHRLEIVPNNKDIIIIDDSYNSNVDGVKSALEVLSTFNGRKIVVTPGLIELGGEENAANLEFGKNLAKVADIVIVIGKHNAEMIIKGLLDEGKTNDEVFFEKNLESGNEKLNSILSAGDVVLFENDLPDTYS